MPFGELLLTSGTSSNRFRYTGQLNDPETGSYYLRARYYQPGPGRFTSRDPLQGSVALPQSLNPYVYGYNNPVKYADPTGHVPGIPYPPGVPPPPGPPPVPVPGADPGTGWKWNKDANNPRGGTWGPDKPVKGQSQPNSSWDPDGHWDVKDGKGGQKYYDENGKELTKEEAHEGWREKKAQQKEDDGSETLATIAEGFGLGVGAYFAYRIIRMIPSLFCPPTAIPNALIP